MLIKNKISILKNLGITKNKIPLSLFITIVLSGCASLFQTTYTKPTVLLATHEKAGRCVILVQDLELDAHLVPYDELPYSQNASAAMWVGTDFPYQKVIDVLKYCHNYYPQIKYIAMSDHTNPGKNRGRMELFIGAPTERALCLGLQAFSDRDKKKLLASRSESDFIAQIQSKYKGTPKCLQKDE